MPSQDLRQPRYGMARVPLVKLEGTNGAAFSGTGMMLGGTPGGGGDQTDCNVTYSCKARGFDAVSVLHVKCSPRHETRSIRGTVRKCVHRCFLYIPAPKDVAMLQSSTTSVHGHI